MKNIWCVHVKLSEKVKSTFLRFTGYLPKVQIPSADWKSYSWT